MRNTLFIRMISPSLNVLFTSEDKTIEFIFSSQNYFVFVLSHSAFTSSLYTFHEQNVE
jgi:hypothetical protein